MSVSDEREAMLERHARQRAELERQHALERTELRVLMTIERSQAWLGKRSLCENAHKLPVWMDVRKRS